MTQDVLGALWLSHFSSAFLVCPPATSAFGDAARTDRALPHEV
jgi:hypothetical protein